MTRAPARGAILDLLWLVAWAAASSLWCLTAAGQLGATFDEPLYVGRGLDFWHTGQHGGLLRRGTMPLPMDVDTLPLRLVEVWRGARFDPNDDFALLLRGARATALIFWWLLLWYAQRLGRALAGPWAGRLAVAWIASEPSLLAHASLATADVPAAACMLAFATHFAAGRDARWAGRVGVPALWLGAALLAKASTLLFGPMAMLVVETSRMLPGPGTSRRWPWTRLIAVARAAFLTRPFRRDVTHVVLLGLGVTILYCGSDWSASPRFVAWARSLPEGHLGTGMVWLAEHLRIFENAGDALWYQVHHNLQSHGWAFILGHAHRRAVWYYFPLLLTIKLTLSLLLMPLVIALVRARALANWPCALAASLVVLSTTIRVQIGIRLVLPLVCFAAIGLAGAGARAYRERAPGWRRRVLVAGATVAVAWSSWSSASVWPDGLAYVNELWGGMADGYRLVSDSNYDWGQGLPELDRWRRERGAAPVSVWYFGTDPSWRALGFTLLPLHAQRVEGIDDLTRAAAGRYLAVSTTLLYGPPISDSHVRAAGLLRARPPAARTTTFLIYDFTRVEAAPQRRGP